MKYFRILTSNKLVFYANFINIIVILYLLSNYYRLLWRSIQTNILGYSDYEPKFIYDQTKRIHKYVCFYVYAETDQLTRHNFKYFLKHGILDYVDYYIIVNTEYSVEIPKRENVIVLFRDNVGFDFGAWTDTIVTFVKRSYEYYIFINSSVRGPYIRKDVKKDWLHLFLELFENKDVHLVGTTLSIYESPTFYDYNLQKYFGHPPPYNYVNSMFFILDKQAFQFLQMNHSFFIENINNITNLRLITIRREMKMSQLILKNNWNINSIVPRYRGLDYRKVKHDMNPATNRTVFADLNRPGAYFGHTLEPFDTIFFKLCGYVHNETELDSYLQKYENSNIKVYSYV